ncbi:MAG: glycosyltransferase family 4 protein [bacterium]|nr:glycosyltransferase family 4 protein [bacterium]
MRVTLLTPYLPHEAIGHGGGVAVRGMARALARRHEVTLVALERPGEAGLAAPTAALLGCRVTTVPFLDAGAASPGDRLRLAASRLGAGLRGLRRGRPYYVEKYRTAALAAAIVDAVAASAPDAVQCEYLQTALLLQDLARWRDREAAAGRPAPRLFLSSHEMGSLPRARRAALTRNPLRKWLLQYQAAAWRRLQADASRWADAVFCVTDQDRDLLAACGGRGGVTIPLGVDTDATRAVWRPDGPPKLLFVGSFGHAPNRSAAEFLVDKVWPRIAQCDRNMSLVLAGGGPGPFLAALAARDPRISVPGFVRDLDALYRDCRLVAAPLTEGGGIKIKILEAMAAGIPVVTTPIGAEGIAGEQDRALWLAAPDDDFARTIRAALADPAEAAARAMRARRLIEERFSWAAIVDRLTAQYEGR